MSNAAAVLLVIVIVIVGAGQVWGEPADIALKAAYTLDPAPNYEHCTDPGDAIQLTDGVYSEGHFWTQPSTVGWSGKRPVVITLDLGEVKPIRGVSYNTAAGAAGVEWPDAILIFVADAEKQFHEVGDLVALSAKLDAPPRDKYAVHRFRTDALQTHGRYVTLAVWGQPYIFVDEVEVYAGEPDWVKLPLPGEPVADVRVFAESMAIRGAVNRRLRNDTDAIRERANLPEIPEAARRDILAELDAVAQAMSELPTHYDKSFRTVLPLNALHARILRAQAKLWQAKGCAAVTVWQTPLWDPLSLYAEPPRNGNATVAVVMMQNEYRAGAFNVSNATPDNLACELRITGLPGGVNPAYVTVHEVAWTDTKSGQPVAAALPEAQRKGDAYVISAPSGLTRQVWLTVHSAEIPPGEHMALIEIRAGGQTTHAPLKLHVYPIRFPDQPRLHFGGWDYTDVPNQYGVTPENRDALIAHLRAHFVDSPWGTSRVLPHAEFDASGTMTKRPDTAHFDAWLKLWPNARQYCVFVSVGNRIGTLAMGTAEFDKAVTAWITFWAQHAQEQRLKPDQIAILLVDEPREAEQDAVILAWAKPIRAANTGIRVWEDPIYHDMSKANPDMVAACNVLCPNRQIFLAAKPEYRDYFVQQRDKGAALEFYSCSGPVRTLDPYAYHRLQAWTCWQFGAQASYFWAFGDTGGVPSWCEYALPASTYTPLFLDATSVTPGKHLEACREGIEDFEYLAMLHDAVAQAAAKGLTGEALDRARRLLAEGPDRVCPRGGLTLFSWTKEMDRTVADAVRQEILEAINACANPTPPK